MFFWYFIFCGWNGLFLIMIWIFNFYLYKYLLLYIIKQNQ
jgi:hypothetical protein